jgi:hypothetical protein
VRCAVLHENSQHIDIDSRFYTIQSSKNPPVPAVHPRAETMSTTNVDEVLVMMCLASGLAHDRTKERKAWRRVPLSVFLSLQNKANSQRK